MIHYTFERHLPTRDAVLGTVRGDVRVPDGPPPRSAVVVVHGFKGFKDWGFFPWVCRRIAAAGHAVVSFNFSGAGIGRDGSAFTELEAFARNTYTRELDELAAVMAEVRDGDLLPRAPSKVGLLGHSRGGGDAILHTAHEDGVDALVTWSAVASFGRWSPETRRQWREDGRIHVLNARTGEHMPLDVGLLDDYETNRDRLDIGRAAEAVGAPWLIVHGTEDKTAKPEDARALARRGRAVRLRFVEGGGHTFGAGHPFEGPSDELRRALRPTLEHFRRHLTRG